MEITRVKHWTKVVQSENVEHVLIGYDDGDSIEDDSSNEPDDLQDVE
jgi:hypothetical protein